MRLPVAFRYLGIILLFNAAFQLIASVVAIIYQDGSQFVLLYSAGVTACFGLFPLIFVPPAHDINRREGILIVIGGWLLSCLVGAIPYILWGGEFTFVDAWFESVSGYATAGSSILNDVEALPKGLLFWRSTTHFIGGAGIIIFVITITPYLGTVGMILFQQEVSEHAREAFQKRSRDAARILLYVYVGLIVAVTIGLWISGLSLFDAMTTSFGTIATGGFSVRNASIAAYDNLAAEIIIMVGMVLGGTSFILIFHAIRGKPHYLFRSSVVRYYIGCLSVCIVIATVFLHNSHYGNWLEALRHASFEVTSIGTGTGFAIGDTSIWPEIVQLMMMFLIVQGACIGSTTGAIKADRFLLIWKSIVRQVRLLLHPKALLSIRLNNRSLDESIVSGSILYFAVYLLILFLVSMILAATGVDIWSAFSGTAAAMGTVGPGFGAVGSAANYDFVPAVGKLALSLVMLVGRLEIFGLLALFSSEVWRLRRTD